MPSNANVRALQAAQPRALNSAADEPASRHTFWQRINASIQNRSLAPRRRTRFLPISIHGHPPAEGRLGRKRAWGGSEPGAEARPGRKRGRGGREYGAAEGSMGRKGRWGGREYGAEGRLGRKAHPDTPTSTLTLKLRHFSARREASTLLVGLGGCHTRKPRGGGCRGPFSRISARSASNRGKYGDSGA